MSESIEDGGKLNEADEGLAEIVVAGGDAAIDFDAAEEVLYLMAAPVVSAMEADGVSAGTLERNATPGTLGLKAGAENIGVEAFVGH